MGNMAAPLSPPELTLAEPIEGTTYLMRQRFRFRVDPPTALPECNIWLQNEHSSEQWECAVHDIDEFAEHESGLSKLVALKAIAATLEESDSAQKTSKTATAPYAPLLSVPVSSDRVLRVPLLIRVAGLVWCPVCNLRLQHLEIDPTEQMRAKLLLAETENAALKVQLERVENEMKELKDAWERPIGARKRARKSTSEAVQV